MRKKIFFWMSCLVYLLWLFSVFPQTMENTLQSAIKNKDPEFFEKAEPNQLKTENQKDLETVVSHFGLESIPSLLGGFKNKNLQVRKTIYKTLLFKELYKKEQLLSDIIERNEYLKPYLFLLRQLLDNVSETDVDSKHLIEQLKERYTISLREAIVTDDYLAVSQMKPEFLETSFNPETELIVKKMGKPALITLIQAIKQSNTDSKNKYFILKILKFESDKGPAQIIHLASERLEIAESLFLTADKERNSEVKNAIIEIAEMYYLTVSE
ncbi:MAG: hypothetical protein H7A23_06260 [Leptospiraceae bacterium]|nr:hypothetical protein [Leptospiraceae bacterium]MCP5494142.1 hypothetical protein [Leptospiraceae bacterium]